MIKNAWFVLGLPFLVLGILAGLVWGSLMFGFVQGLNVIVEMVTEEGEKIADEIDKSTL